MQHFSSTFFVSAKSPAIPKFISMSTPTLTLDGFHSSITLHFDSFNQIQALVNEINTLLEIQREKFSEIPNV